jgi:Cu-Zn family superoxide dismutase
MCLPEHKVMPSHSSLPLLLCMALSAMLCSSTARAQLAVASFDDFDPFNFKQSYLVSHDGQTFEGVVYVKDGYPQNGSLEVRFCDTGDIASQSGLDGCPDLPRYTVGFTCLNNSCSVKLESVPLNACNQIGKAIIIDFFAEPYHIPLPVLTFRRKAVVGFGNVSSEDCPFARKPVLLESAPAIVKMTGTSNSPGFAAQGGIVFQQLGKALSVSGFLTNLPKSSRLGIHLHTFGDIRDNVGASSTGMHFMHVGQQHGLVSNKTRHTGDLGNIVSDKLGNSAFNILVPLDIDTGPILTLLSQNGSAIGRSVILHANADDGVTQPTGNSGARIAQGVVGYAKNVNTSDVLTLLNQGFVNEGFHCVCLLCNAAGDIYAGFCLKSECKNLPPTGCFYPLPTPGTV